MNTIKRAPMASLAVRDNDEHTRTGPKLDQALLMTSPWDDPKFKYSEFRETLADPRMDSGKRKKANVPLQRKRESGR